MHQVGVHEHMGHDLEGLEILRFDVMQSENGVHVDIQRPSENHGPKEHQYIDDQKVL
jgi:hypothetical protein